MSTIFKEEINRIHKVIVHGGVFHLDDLLTVAIIRHEFPDVEVCRENNPNLDVAGPDTGIVIADVGRVYDPERWLFDHHQDVYNPESDTATVKAAVGRMWNAFGKTTDYAGLTELVHAVDLHDTGVKWTPLGAAIRSFAPNWDEKDFMMDEAFFTALEWLQPLVERIIRKDESRLNAGEILDTVEVRDGVMILTRFVPWQGYVKNRDDIIAVVFPGRDPGTWNLQLPQGKGLFPEEWLTTKPDGVSFMVNWRTMITVDTIDRAIALANEIHNRDAA